MARLRSAPAATVSPPKMRSTRRALQEKTNTTGTKPPVYKDDGNMKGLIKNATTKATRGLLRKGDHEDELLMTGALVLTESDAPPSRRDEPSAAKEAVKDDVPVSATARTNRRPPRLTRKPVQKESQKKVLDALKARMEATARTEAGRGRAAEVAEKASTPYSDTPHAKRPAARQSASASHHQSNSSMSPSASPPGELRTGKQKRISIVPPGSVLRPHSTPAVESSILALKNFKRRPRQPSMLQMVQQRTQSTRPSTVHANADENTSVFDLGGDEELEHDAKEEDFAPDAEGTPLHVTKAGARSSVSVKKAQAEAVTHSPIANSKSRKRLSDDVGTAPTAVEALRAKRRKSAGANYVESERLSRARTSPLVRRSEVQHEATPELHDASEVQVVHSSPLSSSRHGSPDIDIAVPSTEEEGRQAQPAVMHQYIVEEHATTPPDGTMADPASSSPPPPDSLTRHHPEELADPVTQASPTRPERRHPKNDISKPMSTATLQSLLPKRRQPPKARAAKRTEYDFLSSSDAEDSSLDASHLSPDEDELGGRLRRRTKATSTKSNARKSTAVPATKQTKRTPQRSRPSRATSTQARKSTAAPTTAAKHHKTYSRRATLAQDKENIESPSRFEDEDVEDDDDTSADPLPDASAFESAELEAARRKFAAVDEWDMEFESMSAEDHRSSSLQWR